MGDYRQILSWWNSLGMFWIANQAFRKHFWSCTSGLGEHGGQGEAAEKKLDLAEPGEAEWEEREGLNVSVPSIPRCCQWCLQGSICSGGFGVFLSGGWVEALPAPVILSKHLCMDLFAHLGNEHQPQQGAQIDWASGAWDGILLWIIPEIEWGVRFCVTVVWHKSPRCGSRGGEERT